MLQWEQCYYKQQSHNKIQTNTRENGDSLSTLAKRIQKSSSFNSPSEKSRACHTQDLSFPACSWTLIPDVTATQQQQQGGKIQNDADPFSNTNTQTRKGGREGVGRIVTEMISTDLESFGLPHNETNLPSLLVLQELDSPSSSLLPLTPIFIEPIQLRFPTDFKTTISRIRTLNPS